MPELPEVETIRSALKPHLTGRSITSVEVRTKKLRRQLIPNLLERELVGRKIRAVRRRGKFLVLELEQQAALVIHLGMTGTLRFEPTTAKQQMHDHIVWQICGGDSLVFNDSRRFGMVSVQHLSEPGANPPSLSNMGPEPLENEFSPQYAWQHARNRTQPIKNLLLDQRFVAGIGNIYANEALWRAGISPRRRSCNISRRRWSLLTTAIKSVLKDAIAVGGTTIRDYRTVDGSEGQFTACLDTYNRGNEPCHRCRGAHRIRRIVMAGRATYYCPGCQR